jgi:transposase
LAVSIILKMTALAFAPRGVLQKRKNWLFANTPKGARAGAVIYSLVETAEENKLAPYAYLNHLFEQLPNLESQDAEILDQLLPWNVKLQ